MKVFSCGPFLVLGACYQKDYTPGVRVTSSEKRKTWQNGAQERNTPGIFRRNLALGTAMLRRVLLHYLSLVMDADSVTGPIQVNGAIYKAPPGGGEAKLWYPQPVDTPNGTALGAEDDFIYFVETWGNSIARIPIRPDGTAGTRTRGAYAAPHSGRHRV
jgi:hypothetical protein